MKKKLILSVLSGALCVFAFAPYSQGYIAWFGFVPLFFALESSTIRNGFIIGWAFGSAFFLGTVYWVVHSMYFYGGMSFAVAALAMLLLVFFLAIFTGLFSILFIVTGSHRGVARLFCIPFIWVSFEYLRGVLFTGFPWVLLGYSQTRYLLPIQMADILGVWGVSFWVMGLNSAVYLFIRGVTERRFKEVFSVAVVTVLAAFVILGYGFLKIRATDGETKGWAPLKVLLVQGNIEQGMKWDDKSAAKTVRIYRDLTMEASGFGEELIVFPETAMPFYLLYDKTLGPFAMGIAKKNRAYLLTGAPHYVPDFTAKTYNLYNSAFLIGPEGGVIGRYDKVHLVPFGEYVPLKKFLFFVHKLTYGIGDFVPGPGPFPLRFGNTGLGILICYEAIFPELSAQTLNNGATLLASITNDAWFGNTSAPYQHFDMNIMRAVEGRVFLIRAANTGISAIIDPAGRVVEKTPLFERRVIKGEVRLKNGRKTFFTRNMRVFPFTSLFFSGIFIISAITKRR
ncbi:MAG: apolipoprotein N-acyltransferase [Deltaproteobacteria bacterium]|nr:apolipoprotein N-acyltransferase [Deltaproteobacteria bacterium]